MKKLFIAILLGSVGFTACNKLDQLPQSTASKRCGIWIRKRIEIIYQFILWNGFSSQKFNQGGCNVRLPGSKSS